MEQFVSDSSEEKHGYDYRAKAENELKLARGAIAEYHLARAQVYATLAVSAQMEDDRLASRQEFWRNS